MKKYMVIETFVPGKKAEVYQRFREKGRLLPEGLFYLNSWVEQDGDRCFQLMETANSALFERWISNWQDVTKFEVVEIGEKPA